MERIRVVAKQVAVLFARRDSVYKTFAEADVWDEDRDAMQWDGGMPVVAHPPCRMWGKLYTFAKGTEAEKLLAIQAVKWVRQHGGVLEHPAHSKLWKAMKLPKPRAFPDEFGGWTLHVNQVHFGHRARKPTWLYIVGVAPADLPPIPTGGIVTAAIGNSRRRKGLRKGDPGYRPLVSKVEREATPLPLAQWLIHVAKKAQP